MAGQEGLEPPALGLESNMLPITPLTQKAKKKQVGLTCLLMNEFFQTNIPIDRSINLS